MGKRARLANGAPRFTCYWARSMWLDEKGGESVEWPLVVALVLLLSIGAWSQFQTNLIDVLLAIANVILAFAD